tara:strand:- start:198 stop:416 length:219 start_codon:yes stop_codon:yes gene_type:complete
MTKKQIVDGKTGISTVVDFTAEEEEQLVKDKAIAEQKKIDKTEADAKRATDKAAAHAKLRELGLTDDQIATL